MRKKPKQRKKTPKDPTWYQLVVDDRVLGFLPDCRATVREMTRLKGLMGISFERAAPGAHLQRNNTVT